MEVHSMTVKSHGNVVTLEAYAAAVEATVREVAARHDMPIEGPVTMMQVGELAYALGVSPSVWFPRWSEVD